MSGANLLFLLVGIVAALAGGGMLAVALGGDPGGSARSTALLIAGMMLLAFGLILGGFAVAFATTKPYDFGKPAGVAS
ncbi:MULTISPECIES: hypothetical protein [Sphingomonas]|uniref:hypothetical protein n=1 Tax=Sphingomonas TaxID=13687 RepID=UPI000DEF7F74|nr:MULTISPECIES: hypothetical protein [Sphingomonas]